MTRVVVPRVAPQAPSRSSTSGAPSNGSSSASTSKEDVAAEEQQPLEVEQEAREDPSPSKEAVSTPATTKVDVQGTSSPSPTVDEPPPPPPPPPASVSASTSTSTLPGSRRGSGSWSAPPRIVIRRVPKPRSSPTSSRAASPRSREEDGYNSADELNPSGFEDEEERDARFQTDLRRVKGLEVKKMAADGNCLFRAVADQVYGDPEMYVDTRQMCIDYMEKERDHFAQFVTEGFTVYCKRKRRDKVYGNNLEIQAMAEMYNRPIHIYSYSTDPINIFHGQYETDLPPIRLSYHRGNHYNSLYDPSRPSVGAGLGFGSLRGPNVDRDQVKAAILAQQDQQLDNALVAEGRYYSDLEQTEQEIERMVMEASRAEYLTQERHRQAGGEPSSSGATSRSSAGAAAGGSRNGSSRSSAAAAGGSVNGSSRSGAAAAAPAGGSQERCQEQRGQQPVSTLAMDDAASRNSNVRMLLSMGFNYLRVMEASTIFGDDVNNMLCYLLETDNLDQSMYRMKGKAAEK